MNDFADWLAEGDLTSDGRSDEVVDIVLKSPSFVEDLIKCLDSQNPVVRGHAADAIEKISREKPEIFLPHIHRLLLAAKKDPVDMVQFHLAMSFGHLALFAELVDHLLAALVDLLQAEGAFTKTWAIASLGIIARLYPNYQARIVGEISKLTEARQSSVRKRAEMSLKCLLEEEPFPENWVKSPAIQAKMSLSA